jgi:hypothetical protein
LWVGAGSTSAVVTRRSGATRKTRARGNGATRATRPARVLPDGDRWRTSTRRSAGHAGRHPPLARVLGPGRRDVVPQPLQYFNTTWLPRYFDKCAHVGFGPEPAARLVLVYLALDLGLWLGGAAVVLLSRRLVVTTGCPVRRRAAGRGRDHRDRLRGDVRPGLLGGTGSLTGAAFMLVVGGTLERSGSFGIAFVLAGAMPLVALAGIW